MSMTQYVDCWRPDWLQRWSLKIGYNIWTSLDDCFSIMKHTIILALIRPLVNCIENINLNQYGFIFWATPTWVTLQYLLLPMCQSFVAGQIALLHVTWVMQFYEIGNVDDKLTTADGSFGYVQALWSRPLQFAHCQTWFGLVNWFLDMPGSFSFQYLIHLLCRLKFCNVLMCTGSCFFVLWYKRHHGGTHWYRFTKT